MMDKEQRKNKYGAFETASGGAAACMAMAPVRRVHHTTDTYALRTEKRQDQMNKWVVLALASSAAFMTTLDSSIVNIGLPSIAHTFHTGVSGAIEWIIIGYLVVIAATLLTFGRLADM